MMFAQLPASARDEISRAFDTLARPGTAGRTPVISEVALPHLCRVMNLSVTEEELYTLCVSHGRMLSSDWQPAKAPAMAAGGVVLLPPCEFDFAAVRNIYDTVAQRMPEHVREYYQFFNLLDINETGRVSQADLRHSLCAAGERLSDDEFNHLLFSNDLLQKPTITVFEFVRLLLRVLPTERPS